MTVIIWWTIGCGLFAILAWLSEWYHRKYYGDDG